MPAADGIHTRELPRHRIIIPFLIVVEPGGAIGPLAGVAQARRRTAAAVASDAIGMKRCAEVDPLVTALVMSRLLAKLICLARHQVNESDQH